VKEVPTKTPTVLIVEYHKKEDTKEARKRTFKRALLSMQKSPIIYSKEPYDLSYLPIAAHEN